MGVITGTIETYEELENGDVLLVSWVYAYDPGRPAPTCSNPSSSLYSDPGDPEEFELGEPIIVCATNEDGYVIPVNDLHRDWLAEKVKEDGKAIEDKIFAAAKANYEREIKFRQEWNID